MPESTPRINSNNNDRKYPLWLVNNIADVGGKMSNSHDV